MILGIGNDIIEVQRIEKLLSSRLGERLLERILTPAERQHIMNRAAKTTEFTAGRFAAKEAVSKAWGCGIGEALGFQDIEILPDANGKPICTISERSLQLSPFSEHFQLLDQQFEQHFDLNKLRVHVSISHQRSMASAFAVVELV